MSAGSRRGMPRLRVRRARLSGSLGLGAVAAVVPAYVPVDLDALQLEDAEDWARQEKRAVGVW